MFLFVLAMLFLIVGLVLLVIRKIGVDGESFNTAWIGIGLVIVGGLFTLWACAFRLTVGEAAVVTSFTGKVQGTTTSAGAHFTAPWNHVTKYDIRNQVVTFAADGHGDGIDDIALTAQTSDNATTEIDMTVRYSLDANKIRQIYTNFHSQSALRNNAILPKIRSISRDAPATFAAAQLRQSRPQLTSDIAKELQTALEPIGVVVDSVDIRGISFDKQIEDSLSAVQQSLAKVQQARADLSTSQIQAEVTKTEAQAQSDSDQIIRCGATSELTTKTVNGQQVSDIKVTPIPQAQCQNRLNENVLTSKYIDMLKIAAQKGDTIYVVPNGSNNLLNLGAATK